MQTISSPKLPPHQILQCRTHKFRSHSLPTIPEQDDDQGVKSLGSTQYYKTSHQKGMLQKQQEKDGESINPKRSTSQFRLFGDNGAVKRPSGVWGFLGVKPLPLPQEPLPPVTPSSIPSPDSSTSSDSSSFNDSFFQCCNGSNVNVVSPLSIPQTDGKKSPSFEDQDCPLGSFADTIVETEALPTTNKNQDIYNNTSGSCSDDEDESEYLKALEPPDPFYPPETPPVQPPKGPQPNPDPTPPTLPPEKTPKKGKNIIMCFDGTSETFGADPHTNVLKFFKLLDRSEKTTQISYYQPGIGTHVKALGAVGYSLRIVETIKNGIDSATAYSLDEKIRQAYAFLMRFYEDHDRVYLIGFSRGGFTARVLAGMIELVGLIHPGLEEIIPTAWNIYKTWEYARKDLKDEPSTGLHMTLADEFKKTFSRHSVKIQFMGLLDSVNSVGILYDRMFPHTSSTGIIRHIRHAMSIDERRGKFKQYPFSHIYYSVAGKYNNNSPNTNASTISTRRNSPTEISLSEQVLGTRSIDEGCVDDRYVQEQSIASCPNECCNNFEDVPEEFLSNPPSPKNSILNSDDECVSKNPISYSVKEAQVLQKCGRLIDGLDHKILEDKGLMGKEDFDKNSERLHNIEQFLIRKNITETTSIAGSSIAGSLAAGDNVVPLRPMCKHKELEPTALATKNEQLPASYWIRARGTTISLLDTPGMNEPTRRSIHGEISPMDHNQACSDVIELWFPGDHSDIGGGWASDSKGGLAGDIPFRWLIGEAIKAGVRFKPGAVEEYLRDHEILPSLRAPLHDSLDARLWGVKKDDEYGRAEKTLLEALFWWIIELLPLPTFRFNKNKDRWSRSVVPNSGRRRVIPLDAKFHWSVSWRTMYGGTQSRDGQEEGSSKKVNRHDSTVAYRPRNLTALHDLVPLSASAEFNPPDDIFEAIEYYKKHGADNEEDEEKSDNGDLKHGPSTSVAGDENLAGRRLSMMVKKRHHRKGGRSRRKHAVAI